MRTRLVTASVVVGLTVVLVLAFSILGQGQQQQPNLTPAPVVVNPDPPCFGSEPISTGRYFDCGNGTVTDTVTGLIWLQQSGCMEVVNWQAANQLAVALADTTCGLTDGSRPGDWRLATKAEWEATIAPAVTLGCTNSGANGPPSLTNDAGTACLNVGPSSFAGVASGNYWSSTSVGTNPGYAWVALLGNGSCSVSDENRTRGVRG